MSIQFEQSTKTFHLSTRETSYQMQISSLGHLRHLYYGRKTAGDCLDYQYILVDCGFSPNAYEARYRRNVSMDLQPQEYSSENTGDFRVSALEIRSGEGAIGTDLRYLSHKILPGKYSISGMPASFDQNQQAETLRILLMDEASGLQVELLYGVFEEEDIITRAARLINCGRSAVTINKAATFCMDIPFGEWEMIHFHGRHCMERQTERLPLMRGIQTVSSRRGASSHHHNPFVILCDKNTTEESGECYGFMLMYSGNHKTDVEQDQMGSVRVVSGIHDEQFQWHLEPGETFETPESILTFTHEGLTRLSMNYHRFIRENVIRSRWNYRRRPILLNSWEATYFDFTAEKLLKIASQAVELGVEMFVLDDGWFGKRDDDNSGLGDWTVNEDKLPGGLSPLIEKINGMGMKFGIWIEPEMVNEDSKMYIDHPDWVLTVPGRKPTMGRNQFVLDLSRREVVDNLYEQISRLLLENNIEYVKWDMNRNMTDVYSRTLPADRQGEVFHRYMLGLYDLLERLTTQFPEVLFEGCSGGGGRFDAGMLAYFPQIWCSDDTDAIERLTIQHGTSYGYPVSTMGSHVSATPNHQTGRSTPLGTRGIVAMSGTFGYELDPDKMNDEEKEEIKTQIKLFDRYYALIQNGHYHRLTDPVKNREYTAWQFAASDGSEALLNLVVTHTRANPSGIHFRLKGLDPDARYRMDGVYYGGWKMTLDSIHMTTEMQQEHIFSGSSLMYAGYTMPLMIGNFPSIQLHFRKL